MMITCAVVLAKQKISSDVETGTAQCKARAAKQQIFEEFATSMNLNLKVFILLLASLPPPPPSQLLCHTSSNRSFAPEDFAEHELVPTPNQF